jgi:tetratricopeptide repeat protein
VAYASEIDKLEARFNENRKGRTFAPLADAYRKAGLIDNAIGLCEEGLKLHPDYVSAWIVYGRCLVDKKEDAQAQEIFGKVLSLDPENVLALRTMAAIAERGKRLDAASEWLTRLLSVDPMNGDAAEALARIKGKASLGAKPEGVAEKMPPPAPRRAVPSAKGTTPPLKATTPPPKAAAPPPKGTTPPPKAPPPPPPKLEIERASAQAPEAVPESVRPSADVETFDTALDFDPVGHEAIKADGLQVEEVIDLEPDHAKVEGLAHTQYEVASMFQAHSLPATPPEVSALDLPAEDESPPIDLPLIMPEDLEPSHSGASAPLAGPPPPPPRLSASRLAPPPTPVPPPPREMPVATPSRAPVTTRLADDDGAADRAALSQAEPVVTETMAELYLKQGHNEDALRVYRALLVQRPGDVGLKNRISAIEGRQRVSGQSVGAFLRRALRPSDLAAAAPPSNAQISTLVAGAFGPVADEAIPGEPTRPAADTISLDSIFGETEPGAGATGGAPELDQEAAGRSGDDAQGAGFSFDEFFRSSAAGGTAGGGGGAGGGAGGPAPRGSGRETRASSDDEADIDQFQAWLKKLKS